MKNIGRLGLIFLIIAALAAFFACTETPPARPEEDDKTDAECEHVFSDFTVTEEPTENSVGVAEGKCSLCGEKTTAYLPKLSEEYYTVATTDATCEKDGEKIYSSSYGDFHVKTAAFGHNFVKTSETKATCVSEGKIEYKCSRCGKDREDIIDRTPHSYEITEEKKATCFDTGYVRYTCSGCGDEVVVYGSEYAHNYGEGTYVPVDCPELGYTEYVCAECGDIKKVYDEGPKHIYGDGTGVCVRCGDVCRHNFDGYICSLCGLDIEERVVSCGYFHCDGDGDGVFDVGEKVYFGFYPKSIVSDEEILRELSLVTPENGVYVLNGKKYVKKELNQRYASLAHFSDGSFVASKIYKDNGYFYRFEPILWTIKEEEDGKILLASDYVIEVSDFKKEYSYDTSSGEYVIGGGGYACAWEESDLRQFLNAEFLISAFDENQRGMIAPAANDNGAESNYYKDKAHANGNETTDFVFVAAYGELFGEDEATEGGDERIVTATDYAIGSGIGLKEGYGTGAAKYYTRSAGRTSKNAGIIGVDGSFLTDGALYAGKDDSGRTVDGIGVVPRVWVKKQ